MSKVIFLIVMILGFGSQLASADEPKIYKCPEVTMSTPLNSGWTFNYSEGSNVIPASLHDHWVANDYMWCLYGFTKDGIAQELMVPVPTGSTCVRMEDKQFSCSKN